MPDQLNALDATFLELEQLDEGATMHIGGIMVFDHCPGGGAPPLADLRAHLASRLHELPRYTQRLSDERTGGLSWPSWKPDARFDIANHVRRAVLPAPGGDAELDEWAADFFSHRLDRTRPLWEMTLVEGLRGGRWGLATKTHHALVDGVGSVGVAEILLDLDPGVRIAGTAPTDRERPAEAEDEHGGVLGAMPRAVTGVARTGAGAARASVHAALHPRETLDRSRSLAELIVRNELLAAPHTSLNVHIGAQRRYTVVRASLTELKRTGRTLGGSVNDVLLCACAAGLRRLLLSRGEALPEQGLRAMVPMNVRADVERLAMGNRISSLFVDLPMLEPDALTRLAMITAETRRLKSSGAADGATAMLDLAGLAPPVLHSSLARSIYATRLFNLTITNVPGPRLPLYVLGAPLREVHPLVPLAAAHCVGIAIFSYRDSVVIGLCADRDSTPDLGVLREGIENALAELHALAAEERGVAGGDRGRTRTRTRTTQSASVRAS